MSAVETATPDQPFTARTNYGSIVIIGGGCYGSYYLRQLDRARSAAALTFDGIVIVDRDPECAVTRTEEFRSGGVSLNVSGWSEYFDEYLGDGSRDAERRLDAIVPSPLMPHLLYQWLAGRARARFAGRSVATVPFELPRDFPWQSEAADGTRYVSFADWTCPINCIEPRICPHTRGERSWSMPEALRTAMSAEAAKKGIKGPVIFHCAHRAYGVGMIDTADVLAADRFVASECAGGGKVLVGTVSHCHGALNVLSVSS